MKIYSEEEYDEIKAWGMSTSFDLYDCNSEKIRDAKLIEEFTHKLCDEIGVRMYGETVIVEFGDDPRVHGYSMVQLIETSLVSAHFAEETDAVYLDVFSCKYYDVQKVIDVTTEFFEGKSYEFKTTLRK